MCCSCIIAVCRFTCVLCAVLAGVEAEAASMKGSIILAPDGVVLSVGGSIASRAVSEANKGETMPVIL